MSASQAHAAAEWLYGCAMPLWLEHGVDRRRGGFFGALDPDSLQNAAPIKRLRVLTRQLYVFCEGARVGVPGAREAVEDGTAYLLEKFAHPEGGYIFACDLDGAAVDLTRDLYDLAFVLFAFAHVYRRTGSPLIRDKASELVLFMDEQMRHPMGGFVEAVPPRLPRRQNPHMHLFEAALAAAEHLGGEVYADVCHRIAALFSSHFFAAEPGLIFEYFDESLQPQPHMSGQKVVEPGHHFEWVWLLSEYQRIFGRTTVGAYQVAAFARRHGVDPASGLLFGQLAEDGAVSQADVRLWAHCEWLKAALVLNEAAGSSAEAWAAIRRFLDGPRRGLWFEQWNATQGRFEDMAVPATTLYHLTSAVVAMTGARAPSREADNS